ncbi:hypothetical protein L53_12990 [Hyphomonas sp. L-53-1-40]|uniref:hypothetical protein n=1 Tax=Hyphomonas sp. L-53-1-40 TaxID=1207058 RepID=UPI0004589F97|nr:hypothetical protein [Hyphomonas sp. L-53-1-40]KCZ62152.1 hypothetical protein L53_12990 [Hyphomonas sp. L-53-1-40]
MQNGKRTREDFTNKIYVDLNLVTSDPLVELIASKLIEIALSTARPRTRSATKEQTKKAIRSLLANLFRTRWTGDALIAISLMKKNYSPAKRFGIGYEAITRAIHLLVTPQVVNGHELEPLVTKYKGFRSPDGYMDNTKLKLRDESVIEWIRLLKVGTKYDSIDPASILLVPTSSSAYSKEVEGLKDKRITPITSTLNSVFRSNIQSAPICLLDDHRQQVEFDRSDETDRMSKLVSTYNRHLDQHRVGLFISDAEIASVLRTTQEKLAERKRAGDYTHTMSQIMGWQANKLHRVFNRSSFECGGRHYGGFWQNLPKLYRPFLTINGHPTVELDFHALHPTMIYHQHGLTLDGDPYEVEGLPSEYRTSAKKALMALVNAKPGARHLESLDHLSLPAEWTPVRLIRALEKKHEAIADSFRSDAGVKLQRLDSDIAEIIMRTMRDQHRALALPVHDSFIVTEDQGANLNSSMFDAYKTVIGCEDIKVDCKATLFDYWQDLLELSAEAKLIRSIEANVDIGWSAKAREKIFKSHSISSNYTWYLRHLSGCIEQPGRRAMSS